MASRLHNCFIYHGFSYIMVSQLWENGTPREMGFVRSGDNFFKFAMISPICGTQKWWHYVSFTKQHVIHWQDSKTISALYIYIYIYTVYKYILYIFIYIYTIYINTLYILHIYIYICTLYIYILNIIIYIPDIYIYIYVYYKLIYIYVQDLLIYIYVQDLLIYIYICIDYTLIYYIYTHHIPIISLSR